MGYCPYVLAPSVVHGNRGRQRAGAARDDDQAAALLAEILRTDLGDHLDLAAGPALEYAEVVERLRSISYTFLPHLTLQRAG